VEKELLESGTAYRLVSSGGREESQAAEGLRCDEKKGKDRAIPLRKKRGRMKKGAAPLSGNPKKRGGGNPGEDTAG